jgi:hypothetical protein
MGFQNSAKVARTYKTQCTHLYPHPIALLSLARHDPQVYWVEKPIGLERRFVRACYTLPGYKGSQLQLFLWDEKELTL